jgi:signal transduction histidine kinase
LSLSLRFVELLGGKLRVVSQPGVGTRMIIELPYPAQHGALADEPSIGDGLPLHAAA